MVPDGYKKISRDNWKRMDETNGLFVPLDPEAPENHWIEAIYEASLHEGVPVEVRNLFAIAQGAMVYGWFFYPLFTLIDGHVLRIAEAAFAHKCNGTRAATQKSWNNKIDMLVKDGVITKEDGESWHIAKKLRNAASHLTSPSLITPPDAIGMLQYVAQEVNDLFPPGSAGNSVKTSPKDGR